MTEILNIRRRLDAGSDSEDASLKDEDLDEVDEEEDKESKDE